MNPQQYLRAQEEVDITGCVRCSYHEASGVFQLCHQPSSSYQVGDKKEFHTCAHMRSSYGLCGVEHRLIKHG